MMMMRAMAFPAHAFRHRVPTAAVGIGAITLAVLGASAAGGRRTVDPTYKDPIYKDRNTVDRLAARRIGDEYACAVVTRATRLRSRRLLIYVTSKEARARANALRATLGEPRQVRVRQTARRYRAAALVTLRRVDVEGTRPREAIANSAIAFESPLDRSRCPRVEITIPPHGTANAKTEAWAMRARLRGGRDRVVIRRAHLRLR